MDVYKETGKFPVAEQYGLTCQLRRAAVSVAANIAEGSGRKSNQDFARFLDMAMGSAAEVRSHLLLAEGLGYTKPNDALLLSEKAHEAERMLSGLSEKIRTGKTVGRP